MRYPVFSLCMEYSYAEQTIRICAKNRDIIHLCAVCIASEIRSYYVCVCLCIQWKFESVTRLFRRRVLWVGSICFKQNIYVYTYMLLYIYSQPLCMTCNDEMRKHKFINNKMFCSWFHMYNGGGHRTCLIFKSSYMRRTYIHIYVIWVSFLTCIIILKSIYTLYINIS